jgi:hypothetical protein
MSVWLPVGTFLCGFALKTLDDLRKERREDRIERERREMQLDDERRHREADFQRETLLVLQEALHDLIRVATLDLLERADDMKRRNVRFTQAEATKQTTEEERALLARVNVLRVRVKDDETRNLTDAVTSKITSHEAQIANSPAAATLMLTESWESFEVLNSHVGELLRERY